MRIGALVAMACVGLVPSAFGGSSGKAHPPIATEPLLDFDVLASPEINPQTDIDFSSSTLLSVTNWITESVAPAEAVSRSIYSTVDDLRSAAASEGTNASLWMDLGRRAYREGDLDLSQSAFEKAHALRPDDPVAANSLACALLRAGRTGRAAELLEDLVLTVPDYTRARFNLACARVIRREYAAAMRDLLVLEQDGWEELAIQLADPDLDPLRGTKDFVALERRLQQHSR